MKQQMLLAVSVLSGMTLVGCGSEDKSFTVNNTTASDFAYTMASQPAVDVTLQQDENNFCQITFLRKNVQPGFSTSLKQKSTGDISSSCYWEGKHYIQSSKHPTLASLTINELNEASKVAKLTTSLKLVDSNSLDEYFELKDIEFTLSGQQFTNLITMPKE
ncbi:hypothetical protein L3X65_02730 [Vibrio diabolicus]|uniref:hypothetical protein n=2 Tax=Vibrio diabolicus TaxID=50719 RepID=UPI00211AE74C|nr:hypothetical protein [Vibrio diabolicus]MCG9228086.1 hypothetical protein [Vibrio diabolicus]MCG9569900.1 hypothetical protein [Vibrio diabolicus]